MNSKKVDVQTQDGVAACEFFVPPGEGAAPAVIMYMDAIGIRPALSGMAERIAAAGYHVLLPNLFYRSGQWQPLEAAVAVKEGPQRDRMMGLLKSLNHKLVMEDTASFLEFLERQPGATGKVGCVGYCMGGGFALSAAGTFPERVRAAASLHGARLATDQPDSPHLLAPKMRGGVYVGIAGLDSHFTAEERERLERALRNAGVRNTVEVYVGVKHGFAVTDTPAHDKAASERHLDRVLKLFGEELLEK